MNRAEQGASFVELAVVAPVMLAILIGFWDIAVDLFARQRMESLATVYVSDKTEPLLVVKNLAYNVANPDNTGTSSLEELSTADANSYLDRVTADLDYILQNSGSGSSQTTISVMARLQYADIYNDGDDLASLGITCNGILPGYAYQVRTVGGSYRSSDNNCFSTGAGGLVAQQAAFDSYVNSINNKIVCPDVNNVPPFGTRNFSAYWDGYDVQDDVVEYFMDRKAYVIVAICANPPRIFKTEPIVLYHVMFPAKEARF